MKLKDKLIKLRKEVISEQKPLDISEEDKFKLLSALYTYNHGNKGCNPFEYSARLGNSENGGGDFSKLENEIEDLGYKIEAIIYKNHKFKLKKDQLEFELRIKENRFLPSDVDRIAIRDYNGKTIILNENSDYIIYLAENGDERAQQTVKNFAKKIGMNGMYENVYETPKEAIKRMKP